MYCDGSIFNETDFSCVRNLPVVKNKAMKSSYLLGPLCDLIFCGFSLWKINIGCTIKCSRVEICKQ